MMMIILGVPDQEAVLLDMSVHPLGTLGRTFLNAAHTLYLLVDTPSKTFSRATAISYRNSVCPSVRLSRPGTDSSPCEIETPCFHPI